MDLGNVVRRTHQAQNELQERFDRLEKRVDALLASFGEIKTVELNVVGADGADGSEPGAETKVGIDTLLLEINAKLDLVLETVATLQPAQAAGKKKATKADPPVDEGGAAGTTSNGTGSEGGAAGSLAGGK